MKFALLFLVSLCAGYISGNSLEEQHVTVVTLMYNTGKECIDSLKSAFAQDYHNFNIIVIDDHSTNGSDRIVQDFIAEQGMQDKVHFIRNAVRRDVTANHEYAFHLCDDNDIVVTLDGDGDMFAHDGVLSYINKIYTEHPETWMTYGSFVAKSTGQRIFHGPLAPEILRTRTVRLHDFVTSHLRTCRAWLFKKVKHEDLLYQGNYPKYAPEIPFIFPMLEMAGDKHVRYIDEILYIYNDHPVNTDMNLYQNIVRFFRSKKPYPILSGNQP